MKWLHIDSGFLNDLSRCEVKGLDEGAVGAVREDLLRLLQGMAALWAMQSFSLTSFLRLYIRLATRGLVERRAAGGY